MFQVRAGGASPLFFPRPFFSSLDEDLPCSKAAILARLLEMVHWSPVATSQFHRMIFALCLFPLFQFYGRSAFGPPMLGCGIYDRTTLRCIEALFWLDFFFSSMQKPRLPGLISRAFRSRRPPPPLDGTGRTSATFSRPRPFYVVTTKPYVFSRSTLPLPFLATLHPFKITLMSSLFPPMQGERVRSLLIRISPFLSLFLSG